MKSKKIHARTLSHTHSLIEQYFIFLLIYRAIFISSVAFFRSCYTYTVCLCVFFHILFFNQYCFHAVKSWILHLLLSIVFYLFVAISFIVLFLSFHFSRCIMIILQFCLFMYKNNKLLKTKGNENAQTSIAYPWKKIFNELLCPLILIVCVCLCLCISLSICVYMCVYTFVCIHHN